MNQLENTVPIVLTFSRNDPTGGAGVQADIETLASIGCHCAPVITGIGPAEILETQANIILEDMHIDAFKIGFIANIENAKAIQTILAKHPGIPVIFDPGLNAESIAALTEVDRQQIYMPLLPLVTFLIVNNHEARFLADKQELNQCGQELLNQGAEYVLISGAHETTPTIINSLYTGGQLLETFSWERLPNHYKGAGCTLSAAIAGMYASELEPLNAVFEAQQYTWEALKHAHQLGLAQHLPNRLFWAQEENHERDRLLN